MDNLVYFYDNWLQYDGSWVNLTKVGAVSKSDVLESKTIGTSIFTVFSIRFLVEGAEVLWNFNEQQKRDDIFESITDILYARTPAYRTEI